MPRLYITFTALAVAALAAADVSIPPCSLNGVLVGGVCVCDAGWSGIACHVLDLLPTAPLTAASQPYFHPSNGGTAGGGFISNSWGLSVARDDSGSLWHGFMTEMAGNCSLSSWTAACKCRQPRFVRGSWPPRTLLWPCGAITLTPRFSRTAHVLHLTSPSPSGPWAVEGVALPKFAHNPQVIRAADGAWLLLHIGSDEPAGCEAETCPGHHNASCSGHQGTSIARAESPWGPWERVPFILPDNETNPSGVVLPDGSIAVTARRWEGGVPT